MQDMQSLIAAVEPAKDVASAEAALQGHRERKGEIDADEDSFKATSQFGQTLLSSGHFATEEIKSHLQLLASQRAALLASWEEKREQFEQTMELQVFIRDTEQADSWMAKQEVQVYTLSRSRENTNCSPCLFSFCSHFWVARMWATLWML